MAIGESVCLPACFVVLRMPLHLFVSDGSLACTVLGQVVEVDDNAPVTLHAATAAQEHRLLGQLHTLEGKINQATGMVHGGRGRVFKVAKGQNLELVPIEVFQSSCLRDCCD